MMENMIRQIVSEEIEKRFPTGKIDTTTVYLEGEGTDLYTDITHMLNNFGTSPSLLGYHYIREAVMMVYNDNIVLNQITRTLYPSIAKKFNTTPSRTERAIRHAIEKSWYSSNSPLMGIYKNMAIDKPTNSSFIATVVEKLKLDRKDY